MRKMVAGALIACALFLNVSCSEKARTIKVFGSGEVTYIPDIVTMTVNVKNGKPPRKKNIRFD